MKRKLILLLSFGMISVLSVKAQDVHFSQYFSNPLLLNPAYAGSIGCSRLAINFRDQWPSIPGRDVTFSASYDQYVKPILGGVGIQVISDNEGGGALTTNTVNAIYAFNLNLKSDLHIRIAAKAGYNEERLNMQDIITIPFVSNKSTKYYFNAGAGLLIAYKNFTGGFCLRSYQHS